MNKAHRIASITALLCSLASCLYAQLDYDPYSPSYRGHGLKDTSTEITTRMSVMRGNHPSEFHLYRRVRNSPNELGTHVFAIRHNDVDGELRIFSSQEGGEHSYYVAGDADGDIRVYTRYPERTHAYTASFSSTSRELSFHNVRNSATKHYRQAVAIYDEQEKDLVVYSVRSAIPINGPQERRPGVRIAPMPSLYTGVRVFDPDETDLIADFTYYAIPLDDLVAVLTMLDMTRD